MVDQFSARTLSQVNDTTGRWAEMIIDCDSCQVRPAACGDCVVSFVLGPMPWAAGDGIAEEEREALAVLADSGLLPPLRLVPQADSQRQTHSRVGRAVS